MDLECAITETELLNSPTALAAGSTCLAGNEDLTTEVIHLVKASVPLERECGAGVITVLREHEL